MVTAEGSLAVALTGQGAGSHAGLERGPVEAPDPGAGWGPGMASTWVLLRTACRCAVPLPPICWKSPIWCQQRWAGTSLSESHGWEPGSSDMEGVGSVLRTDAPGPGSSEAPLPGPGPGRGPRCRRGRGGPAAHSPRQPLRAQALLTHETFWGQRRRESNSRSHETRKMISQRRNLPAEEDLGAAHLEGRPGCGGAQLRRMSRPGCAPAKEGDHLRPFPFPGATPSPTSGYRTVLNRF